MGWGETLPMGIVPSSCHHFFQRKGTDSSTPVEDLEIFLLRGQGILEVFEGHSKKGRFLTVCPHVCFRVRECLRLKLVCKIGSQNSREKSQAVFLSY